LSIQLIVFDTIKGKKIRKLKFKHKKEQRDWYAREEIVLLRRMLSWVKKGYNKFGSKFLKGYYNKWYHKVFKFEVNKKKKDILLKILKNNYIFLFYMISVFDFVLKVTNPIYPKKNYLE